MVDFIWNHFLKKEKLACSIPCRAFLLWPILFPESWSLWILRSNWKGRACFPGYLSDCQAAHDFFRLQCFKSNEERCLPMLNTHPLSVMNYIPETSSYLWKDQFVILMKLMYFFYLFNGRCCLFCQIFSALLLSRGANQRQRLGFESIAGYLGVLGKRPAEHKLVPNRLTLDFCEARGIVWHEPPSHGLILKHWTYSFRKKHMRRFSLSKMWGKQFRAW